MILKGAMVTIAGLCLILLHSGISFKGHWVDANFRFRLRKAWIWRSRLLLIRTKVRRV
jgi:hypothetical protein